jgi:3'-phosphoadenosine 5'-phosphosulfate (PAPS) 3'-phosphatase
MYEELEAAKKTAVRAGARLLKHYSRSSAFDGQGENPTEEARQSVGSFMVEELKESFPGDGILSQENSDQAGAPGKPRVWMIDPLDGMLEFQDGRDEFAVMIGLSVDGTANLGVVYQPRIEKMYYALLGSGAFLIENRATRLLQVPRESNPRRMTIVHSRLANTEAVQREVGVHGAMLYGSIGLNVGLISEGAAHLYVHAKRYTHPWDTCAPQVILHEAGGRMTDRFNAVLRYDQAATNPGPVIASNGAIHDQIVRAVQSLPL